MTALAAPRRVNTIACSAVLISESICAALALNSLRLTIDVAIGNLKNGPNSSPMVRHSDEGLVAAAGAGGVRDRGQPWSGFRGPGADVSGAPDPRRPYARMSG